MVSDYLTDRLAPQMEYYSKACKKLQHQYYCLSICSIVATAIIPILSLAVESCSEIKYLISTVSAVATVASSILLLRKTRENWLEYRASYELLKSERAKYLAVACEYSGQDSPDALNHLVACCEEIMGNEHKSWRERMVSISDQR